MFILTNPNYILIILDFEVYKPTTLQKTYIIYKWEKLRREYINKIGYTYCVAFVELLFIKKSKRYNILIKAESSVFTQLKIERIGLNSFLNKIYILRFISKRCLYRF